MKIKYVADDYFEDELSPEKKMWSHVLVDGLFFALKGKSNEIQWVNSNVYGVGTFLWICDELEIDPIKLKKMASTKTPLKYKQLTRRK